MVKTLGFQVAVLFIVLLISGLVAGVLRTISRRRVRLVSLSLCGFFCLISFVGVVWLFVNLPNNDVPLESIMTTVCVVMIPLALQLPVAVLGIPRIIVTMAGHRLQKKNEKLFNWLRSIANFLLAGGCLTGVAIVGLIIDGAVRGRNEIDIRNVVIESPRVPFGFNGYKIVQFSDMHLGGWGQDTTFVSRLVDSINSQKADLIVFTGDLVTRESTEMLPFLKLLSRLKAKDGVYSVLGNHDYGIYRKWDNRAEEDQNLALIKSWEHQIGWKMLNNSNAVIKNNGDSIILIGVENWGEPPFSQHGRLVEASVLNGVRTLSDNNFKVLLSHNPEHWRQEVVRISNIDLTLSGHTHAMQVAIGKGKHKFSPATMKYHDWGGLYESKKDSLVHKLYVNRGVGEVGLPARIMDATPEITVLTLKKTN